MKKHIIPLALLLALLLLCAFAHTALAADSGALHLPRDTHEIEAEAFYRNKSIRHAQMPEGLLRICYKAFANSGLTSAYLPSSLTYIADNAFDGCPASLTFTVTKGSLGESFAKTKGYLYRYVTASPASDFGYSLENGKCTIVEYYGSDLDVVIPARIDGYPVTTFQPWGRSWRNIRTLILPDSITHLGGDFGCFGPLVSLTSVFIPGSVTHFARNCFADAPQNLYCAYLAEGITKTNEFCFSGLPSLYSVRLPSTLIQIDSAMFMYCPSLEKIQLPPKLTRIADRAFWGCTSLPNLTFPDGLKYVDYGAFISCNRFTAVNLPDSVIHIGSEAFCSCPGLTSFTFPPHVTYVSEMTFQDCHNLKKVVLPDGITYIGGDAFRRCYSLTSVNLPKGVTLLENLAFADCTALKTLTLPASISMMYYDTFEGCTQLTLRVVKGSYAESYARQYDIPYVTYTP